MQFGLSNRSRIEKYENVSKGWPKDCNEDGEKLEGLISEQQLRILSFFILEQRHRGDVMSSFSTASTMRGRRERGADLFFLVSSAWDMRE